MERDETMDLKLIEARENVVRAREALRRGDKDTARDLGEKAALLAPDLEDAWLILVASDSNPEDALAYAQKALELNPASTRANKAQEWAKKQLEKARSETGFGLTVDALSLGQLSGLGNVGGVAEPVRDERKEAPVHRPTRRVVGQQSPTKKANWQPLVYVGLLFGFLICAVIGVVAWSAFRNPALTSFLSSGNIMPTQEVLWAQVEMAKPSVTPIDVSAFAAQSTEVVATPPAVEEASTLAPTKLADIAPSETPSSAEEVAAVPEATETPGVMAMEILANTPTSAYVAPTNAPVVASGNGKGGARWIDVNLSTQSVYAYEGDTVVNSFVVSTGTWMTPTVTGKFNIWIKLKSTSMSGPGYYLPNVPYTMYFYKGYGLHGTYWHNNFGTPMSHGCVNLRTSDAEWLYNWASVGTVVNVHY
jgi:lipoprotein-anchoring transpeptidase ErfK/SrfK